MKKKLLLIPFASVLLVSCAKTNLLYDENAYNSPIFDENYYTNWEGIDSLKIHSEISGMMSDFHSEDGLGGIKATDVREHKWLEKDEERRNEEWGRQNNLTKIDSSFNYGITSKLYDGRVRCEGYFQKSRVQLAPSGFATYFPKCLVSSNYFAFACRGGSSPTHSNLPQTKKSSMEYNFKVSFYKHITNSDEYDKVVYNFTTSIQTDNSGSTNLISFYFPFGDTEYLNGSIAMSLEWELLDDVSEYNLTTNPEDKEKDHLALMLYEVFLGNSEWF